ncbi:MAG: aromatic ring-hydroxylating dioxygenase subunit alpha [Actinomycetota bacterium]|nr:MAG: aromatic ring-hydroxylating dioxygenase subunit alpha [Actinomycetota bacterium]
MLSASANERLTHIGPGTPAGNLLRRYWQPICASSELSEAKPTKPVTVMGESLVVFRDGSGNYGCLAERCAHRGCSLAYGFIEEDGLRCPYHGWKYSVDGKCLEQPFEGKASRYKEKIRQLSYPVERLGGLLFVYMGPSPAPLLPRWDVLVRSDGAHKLRIHPVLNCNWFQAQENSVDTVHTHFLHGQMMKRKGLSGGEYYLRPIESYGFELSEWGIVKWREFGGDKPEREKGHPAVFPNMLRVPEGPWHAFHWRVPIDDYHTQIFWAGFLPGEPIGNTLDDPPVVILPSFKDEDGIYLLDSFQSQDTMAWESEGPLFDRTREHLGASDRGIALWRKLMLDQIEVVENGGEPMALLRDPSKNTLITFDVSEGQARNEFVEVREDYYAMESDVIK